MMDFRSASIGAFADVTPPEAPSLRHSMTPVPPPRLVVHFTNNCGVGKRDSFGCRQASGQRDGLVSPSYERARTSRTVGRPHQAVAAPASGKLHSNPTVNCE
jgi:hypothetical protein